MILNRRRFLAFIGAAGVAAIVPMLKLPDQAGERLIITFTDAKVGAQSIVTIPRDMLYSHYVADEGIEADITVNSHTIIDRHRLWKGDQLTVRLTQCDMKTCNLTIYGSI